MSVPVPECSVCQKTISEGEENQAIQSQIKHSPNEGSTKLNRQQTQDGGSQFRPICLECLAERQKPDGFKKFKQ
jgi:hypothetical protein